MNYYKSRQRDSDGKWDFTKMNDGVTYGVGYCCEFQEFTPDMHVSEAEQEKHQSMSHKYHTDGHETEEEACECYRQYVLDHRLSLGRTMSSQKQKCRICGEWTQHFAEVYLADIFVLCSEHNNRESVEGLYKAPKMCCTS